MSDKVKLLVVEDDPGITTYLNATLRANGYDVILAENGEDALRLAASHCPDCMLLDLGLPDLASAHGRWRSAGRRTLGSDTLEIYERTRCLQA